MSRGQEIRLGLVVAVARLLGVPVGVRDGAETEAVAEAGGGDVGPSRAARGGPPPLGRERRTYGRVVSFRQPGDDASAMTGGQRAETVEDILRKA